jgi:hypothetical protein
MIDAFDREFEDSIIVVNDMVGGCPHRFAGIGTLDRDAT